MLLFYSKFSHWCNNLTLINLLDVIRCPNVVFEPTWCSAPDRKCPEAELPAAPTEEFTTFSGLGLFSSFILSDSLCHGSE